ncbi:MAG TPA: branched-chain amino acid ABC transporter permease [Burkholderiaceae bacterium]
MTLVEFANLVINGLVEGAVIALPALALTLVMGIARFPNAATGDWMTLGAYVAVGAQALWVGTGLGAPALGMLLATLAGAAACAGVAMAAYELIFRRLARSAMVASLLASIGLAFFVRSLITLVAGSEQRTFALPLVRAWNFGGVRLLPTDLMIAAVALLVLVAVFAWLRFGRSGRLLRAVASNPELARLSGIRSQKLMWMLWALAGTLSAIGGVLLGVKSVVMPELGWEMLLPAFAAMVLGGIGSPVGAVVGALLTGVGQELSVPFVGPSYKIAIAFALLVVTLLVRPAGLFGRPEQVR